MPKDPFAREREMVVQVACHALTRTIAQYSPVGTDTLPIAAVSISRMFADLINRLSSALRSSMLSTDRSNNAVIGSSARGDIEKRNLSYGPTRKTILEICSIIL